MTITSFTDSRKSYEVTETSCTCADFYYRGSRTGKPCKHIIAVEAARAAKFLKLFKRFDYRANGDLDTRRCYYEMSLAGAA